jgi:hypothetical protein
MKINDAFPSKYLKAEDLQGRPATLRMGEALPEMLDGEQKIILYFQGKKKGLVLNVTNAKKIAEVHGEETNDWYDRTIEIYPTETDYAGKTVPCIRIRAARAEARSGDRQEPRREAAREPARDERHSERREFTQPTSGPERVHDREVDDRVHSDPPPRQAARSERNDMDDEIPF